MPSTLAQTADLVSIYKPILMLLVLLGWAWSVTVFDKDLERLFLARRMWNGVQLAAGAFAFLLWLLIPLFWIGLFLALLILGGTLGGYIYYRNSKVSEDQKWTLSLETFQRRVSEMQQQQAERRATVHLLAADGSLREVPTGEDEHADAHVLLEQIMDFALHRQAERIDLAVAPDKAALNVVVDGVKYAQPEVEPRLALALIDYLKESADMDVSDRRRRQVARLGLEAHELGHHQLELHTAGSTRGVTMAMVVNPRRQLNVPFEQLGLMDQQRTQLVPVLDESQRLVIVSGPPHSGLTTTLYSLMQRHDPYTQSLMTLEQRIELDLEGANQQEIEAGTKGEQLAGKVAGMVRRDANVIMLSSVSDAQVAKTIAQNAEEVRFYFALHVDDTFQALKAWVKASGDVKTGAHALGAILNQRLVRRLCPTCRVAYKPDEALLRKLNLPADKVRQLYKHSGKVLVRDKEQPCTDCHGIGYRGRVGVFEVMVLDDEARRLVAAGELDNLRAHLRRNRMVYLQEAALHKAVEGVTSISEITRALAKQAT